MVKVSIKVVRDAQYEAQQRTVEVSSKPAVGKEMFSDQLNQAAEGSFIGSFQTERFVHGKVREFTLRSALRIPSNASVYAGEHMKEIEDALMYRVIAESIDHTLGNAIFTHIPKALRVYVMAKMIQDSDMSIMNQTINQSRDSLQARLRLRGVLKRAGVGSDLHKQVAGLLIAAFNSNKTSIQQQAHAGNAIMWIALLCGLTASELPDFSFDHVNRNFPAHTCKGSRVNSVKLQSIQMDSSSSRTSQYGVASRIEEGFGTAPIWYQQSMATGPPL